MFASRKLLTDWRENIKFEILYLRDFEELRTCYIEERINYSLSFLGVQNVAIDLFEYKVFKMFENQSQNAHALDNVSFEYFARKLMLTKFV